MTKLPEGFVYLSDIDPTIIESVRYAGSENFMGKSIDGYNIARIILSEIAAEAVKNIQKKLKQYGFGLVVYDGYRPQKAVNSFIKWSENPKDQSTKNLYYPTINKENLFELGYLAKRSAHSRGSTVDLSLISFGKKPHPIKVSYKTLNNGDIIPILDDGTVNMGAGFDLFHEVSHHDSPFIDQESVNMRTLLRTVMKNEGFEEYKGEWWHYTFKNEPYPDTYFDFEIK